MKKIIGSILLCGAALALSLNLLQAQTAVLGGFNGNLAPVQSAPDSIIQIAAEAQGLSPLSPNQVPHSGTFWLFMPGGIAAPAPCPPLDLSVPIYQMASQQFLVDETGGQVAVNMRRSGLQTQTTRSTVATALEAQANTAVNLITRVQTDAANEQMRAMGMNIPSFNDGGGSPDTNTPPDISNYIKYMAQSFSVIDTNVAASSDINLYNALLAFGEDTNTAPTLKLATYKPGCLILKASHFDYSSETRDFCLVVCDKVETPLFKTLDIQNPSNNIQNGGWLLQGSVPPGQVTDPMFLMVSNTSRLYNGFFRAIPYGGSEISINGYNTYDVVSGTINLQVDVTDLSGITNVNFKLDASGVPVRSSITGPDTISIDTRYNLNSYENLDFHATTKPSIWNSDDSPVDNPQLSFSSLNTLTLDFENPVFLAYQSDEASTDIGQNDIDFYATVQVNYSATITDLNSGRLLKSFSGTSAPGYIPLYWNFTESDGVTSWTNEQYVVSFTASPTSGSFAAKFASSGGATPADAGGGGSTINITNKIDTGVKKGAGCIITYQEEDPGDLTGSYWNSKSLDWAQTLKYLYVDIYGWASLTQYYPSDCGANRNHGIYFSLGSIYSHWSDFLPPVLTNANYSDLDIIGAHGDGETIGYSRAYYNNKFSTTDLFNWLGDKHAGSNWRLRRTTIWACWSGADPGSGYITFPQAVGIRPVAQQMTTYCYKNAGLFFGGKAPQLFVNSGNTISPAQASEMLDETFMCGAYPWPGACDPTYSFKWAIQALEAEYPEMMYEPKDNGSASTTPSLPLGAGCPKLIFTTTHDSEITTLNFGAVKE